MPDNYCLRLPTEAEWEKAARGGMKLPQQVVTGKITELKEVREEELGRIANPSPKREYPWEVIPGAEEPAPEKANYKVSHQSGSDYPMKLNNTLDIKTQFSYQQV